MKIIVLPLPFATDENRELIALRELQQYPPFHLKLSLKGLLHPAGCPVEWEQQNARIAGFVTRSKGEPLAPFSL